MSMASHPTEWQELATATDTVAALLAGLPPVVAVVAVSAGARPAVCMHDPWLTAMTEAACDRAKITTARSGELIRLAQRLQFLNDLQSTRHRLCADCEVERDEIAAHIDAVRAEQRQGWPGTYWLERMGTGPTSLASVLELCCHLQEHPTGAHKVPLGVEKACGALLARVKRHESIDFSPVRAAGQHMIRHAARIPRNAHGSCQPKDLQKLADRADELTAAINERHAALETLAALARTLLYLDRGHTTLRASPDVKTKSANEPKSTKKFKSTFTSSKDK